jgi:hypothetical protein
LCKSSHWHLLKNYHSCLNKTVRISIDGDGVQSHTAACQVDANVELISLLMQMLNQLSLDATVYFWIRIYPLITWNKTKQLTAQRVNSITTKLTQHIFWRKMKWNVSALLPWKQIFRAVKKALMRLQRSALHQSL